MLDDDARRALEEEAIALVSLSHSHPPKKTRRAPTVSREAGAVASTNKRSLDDRFVPSRSVFATSKHNQPQNQVHLMESPSVRFSGDLRLREAENDPRFLSMSVFVNADGEMNEMPGTFSKMNSNLTASFEEEDISKRATGFIRASSPTTSDPPISMQSLLVTLKKRKAGEVIDDGSSRSSSAPMLGAATKLPRFRDVFEPPRVPELRPLPPAPRIISFTKTAPQSQSPTPMDHDQSQSRQDQSHPAPPELKCKYRTGKCTNTRALKSCGDYHNLCNYHRLRANANQRKLDRKKKVQRVPSSSSEVGSPISSSGAAVGPAVAAAAALASLPSSLGQADDTQVYLPYFVPSRQGSEPPSHSS